MQIAESSIVFLFVSISIILLVLISFIASIIYTNKVNQSIYLQKTASLKIETEKITCKNISREIHDYILYQLTVSKNNLLPLKSIDSDSIEERASFSIDLISQVITDLRNISELLSYNRINNKSLPELIDDELKDMQKLGYTVSLKILGTPSFINIDLKKHIVSIIQESLRNIITHAKANKIICNLIYNELTLEISILDNGKGFDYLSLKTGSGLNNIRARMKELKGTITIRSNSISGTIIHLYLPI